MEDLLVLGQVMLFGHYGSSQFARGDTGTPIQTQYRQRRLPLRHSPHFGIVALRRWKVN